MEQIEYIGTKELDSMDFGIKTGNKIYISEFLKLCYDTNEDYKKEIEKDLSIANIDDMEKLRKEDLKDLTDEQFEKFKNIIDDVLNNTIQIIDTKKAFDVEEIDYRERGSAFKGQM